jgi:hypothetical protein
MFPFPCVRDFRSHLDEELEGACGLPDAQPFPPCVDMADAATSAKCRWAGYLDGSIDSLSGTKKPISRIFGVIGGDGHKRLRVNGRHLRCFCLPIIRIVLDDAKTIDPYVVDTKETG